MTRRKKLRNYQQDSFPSGKKSYEIKKPGWTEGNIANHHKTRRHKEKRPKACRGCSLVQKPAVCIVAETLIANTKY